MDTALFDYHLPPELIAQHAIEPRDQARLLVVPRCGPFQHRRVCELPELLAPGDLLVFNRSRVIPARLFARTAHGGQREVLLVHAEAEPGQWRVLIGGRVQCGQVLELAGIAATVTALHEDGTRSLRFPADCDVLALAEAHGTVPLPPYIARPATAHDRARYQTVYADRPGSVAAPTAGLHFTEELLQRLAERGVARAFVELHIGPGTFKPIDTAAVEDFRIHAEWACCPAETVAAIAAARARGRRVIAVGTTVVRTLESAARQPQGLAPWQGWTSLYLHPPQRFCVVDALFTNFHLPRSTLLALVACLTGLERWREAYETAVRERYRFLSYGDACFFC
ncbi:MAG: tRNA preQ1(34) S-adenosylmethionine ribosyltransferase-isomerase QueA [Planctomycetota bacterium]|nr:tRNA preQ1(34) S-adenosylmethionine ribosyltransferase-isomerase QueA [Planctomycetota bacterium]